MRKKLVTAVAVGALGLSGVAVTGTALASTPSTTTNGTAASPLDRIKQALGGLVADKTITQAQADKVASTLSAAGVDRGGFGHHGMPDLAAAAKALNMTEADLRTALMSGKSLAAVAKEKNVPVDTLVTALVTDAKQRIAQEVTAGRITQAQADARIKDLQARITERVNATRPAGGEGGFGGRHGGGWGPGAGGPGGTAPSPAPSASASASASASSAA